MPSPLHTRNGIRTQIDAQWQELQWQQDQPRIDLKGTNVVKTWSEQGSILVNSSFEHTDYHYQTPASTTPGLNLD